MKEEKGQAILESACCIVFILFALWSSTDCFRMLFYRADYQQYANAYVKDESFAAGERYLPQVPKGVQDVFVKAESVVEEKTIPLPMDLEYTTRYEVRAVELKVKIKRMTPIGLLDLYEYMSGGKGEKGTVTLTVKATGVVDDEKDQKQ